MNVKFLKKLSVITMVLLLSAFLYGCGESGSVKEADSPEENATKTLNLALFWLDADIDPINGWNGWTLNRTGVGENLVQVDENMQFKPSIAESYKQIDDYTVEFTIRDNVYFHNDKKVDALACKKSIERALNESDRKDVKFPVDEIIAEGQVLTVKTAEPIATLLNRLADTVFIIVDADAAASDENFKYHPVCTGAFKVIEFDQDKGMVLHKHEKHWGSTTNVDVVNVKYISDGTTRTMALQSGELDIATQINAKDLELLENDGNFTIKKGPNLRIFLLRLNMEKPYMSELEFRQALSYGADKETYAAELVNGIPAKGPFNDQLSFGYRGEDYYKYDPQKAIELLDGLGYVDTDGDGIRECDGKNIVLKFASMTNHGGDANSIGVAMQQQYKEIGIGMEVIQLENYADIAKSGDFDMLWERWTSAPTSDPQYFIDSGYRTGAAGNYGKYSNEKIDQICETLDTTFDKVERDRLGTEAAEELIKDVSSLYMYYQEGNVVTNNRVDGVFRFVSEVYYIDGRVTLK